MDGKSFRICMRTSIFGMIQRSFKCMKPLEGKRSYVFILNFKIHKSIALMRGGVEHEFF